MKLQKLVLFSSLLISLPLMAAELEVVETFKIKDTNDGSIIKYHDTSNNVYCYVLKPDALYGTDKTSYDIKLPQFNYNSNNIGSISCVSIAKSK